VDDVSFKTHKTKLLFTCPIGILIYLSYLAHEYFVVSLNFLKMQNRLEHYYEINCMKDVANCTPALE